MLAQLYTFTRKSLNLKCVNFMTCKLCLNKVVKMRSKANISRCCNSVYKVLPCQGLEKRKMGIDCLMGLELPFVGMNMFWN